MANIATTNSTFEQISSLSQLHFVRQIAFMLVMAAGIALGVAIVLWSTQEDFVPLYQDITAQDSNDIINALEQNANDYKLDSRTGLITVSASDVQRIRLQLASAGLPRATNRGFDILEDEQNLGTSNYIEEARYNRALEQELVATIKHMQGVRDARVHLSIPKQTSFIRGTNKPSASVMIDLASMQILNEVQLMGISHLVSSSVIGLETENVSIVDQKGNLLSQNEKSEFKNSNENIRYTRSIEQDYNQRIIDILTPIVGAGNVRAQVSADLDFTFIETTEETFNPNTTVVRSEQTQEENTGSNNSSVVEPGTLSPTPPAAFDVATSTEQVQSGSANQSRLSSTRNYEMDRSVSLIRRVPGTITRLSVAVLVDLHAGESILLDLSEDTTAEAAVDGTDGADAEPAIDTATLDQEKIDRLSQLVRDTIGFNPARGDSVNVINESFFVPAEIEPEPELPIWQQEWVLTIAKQVGASLVVLFLIFGVLRPAMKSAVSVKSNLPNRPGARLTDESGEELEGDVVSLSNNAEGVAALNGGGATYDVNLNVAKEIVEKEPAKAARMIKSWVAE